MKNNGFGISWLSPAGDAWAALLWNTGARGEEIGRYNERLIMARIERNIELSVERAFLVAFFSVVSSKPP